jgi:hypothetical protein
VNAAAVGGMEALRSPEPGTSRAENAAEGAAWAAAGGALIPAAIRALRGAKPTRQAQELVDRGIRLTPGMASNGWRQELEQRLALIPGLAGAIRNRQREALTDWNKDLLGRTAPSGAVSAAGHQGFREVQAAFKDAYENLWKRDLPLNVPVLGGFWQHTIERARQNLSPEAATTFADTLRRLMSQNIDNAAATTDGVTVAGRAISHVDDLLRNEAVQAGRRGEGALAGFYKEARAQLKGLLPNEFTREWQHLDDLYSQFATLRRSAGYKGAAAQEGIFTPSQLLSASIAKDKSAGKGAVAKGEAILQKEATAALKVLGDDLPGQAKGTAEKLALPALGVAAYANPGATLLGYGAGRAAFSPFARDLLSFDQKAQQEALIQALRASGVGAAAAEE